MYVYNNNLYYNNTIATVLISSNIALETQFGLPDYSPLMELQRFTVSCCLSSVIKDYNNNEYIDTPRATRIRAHRTELTNLHWMYTLYIVKQCLSFILYIIMLYTSTNSLCLTLHRSDVCFFYISYNSVKNLYCFYCLFF